MAQMQHIVHSIPPTFDKRSRVLVLGSMPSPASREAGFNYGHPRNRFWQVMAQLAGEPLPTTTERRRDFCLRHHIALWDVLAQCDIEGASDASIRNAVPNRLTDITSVAPIEAVFCTGAKSYELYNKLCADEVGIPAVKLPSTSPANAACTTQRLMEAYAAIFEHEHAFEPPTLDVSHVVELEQTIAANGIPLRELMERAGAAVAHTAQRIAQEMRQGGYPTWLDESAMREEPICADGSDSKQRVTILCGNGNNGGDGWVAAKLLAQAGAAVCVVTARMPEQLSAQPAHDATLEAMDVLESLGARVISPADHLGSDELNALSGAPLVLVDDGTEAMHKLVHQAIDQALVVVDAILGTGSKNAPRAPFSDWVNWTNDSRESHALLAVDVPSGISASTGDLSEPYVRADETLTMIVSKPGLAFPTCGRVSVAPLAYIEPLL